MFEFLKKKSDVPQAQATLPPIQPLPNDTTFQVGKEVQIRDPKTGEYVYRMAMSPENRKMIFDVIHKNSGVGQRLINLAVNIAGIFRQLEIEDKGRIASEQLIETTITKIRDDMKLDRRWGLNMQLGVLERREPPES